jgi:hypothetical protein
MTRVKYGSMLSRTTIFLFFFLSVFHHQFKRVSPWQGVYNDFFSFIKKKIKERISLRLKFHSLLRWSRSIINFPLLFCLWNFNIWTFYVNFIMIDCLEKFIDSFLVNLPTSKLVFFFIVIVILFFYSVFQLDSVSFTK